MILASLTPSLDFRKAYCSNCTKYQCLNFAVSLLKLDLAEVCYQPLTKLMSFVHYFNFKGGQLTSLKY